MLRNIFGSIRHFLGNNKKFMLLLAAYIITIYVYYENKKKRKEMKDLNRKLQLIRKIRALL